MLLCSKYIFIRVLNIVMSCMLSHELFIILSFNIGPSARVGGQKKHDTCFLTRTLFYF